MLEGLFQPMHLLVIFGIALMVFGPKKLPELGKGIGEGIRGFKSALKEDETSDSRTTKTLPNRNASAGVVMWVWAKKSCSSSCSDSWSWVRSGCTRCSPTWRERKRGSKKRAAA